MTRPEDIPQDVLGPYHSAPEYYRQVADEIANGLPNDPALLAGAICAALCAERERCAKVAENWRPFPKPTSRAAMYWLNHCAIPDIAAAIRETE